MEDKPNDDEIQLTDGTFFAIGGMQSTLKRMVDADKIGKESVVFSIGPSEVATDGTDALDKSDEPNTTVDVPTLAAIENRNQEERYSVERDIARGGMGSILMAEDSDLRRFVAMKVLLEPGDITAAMCERFVKEAQVTGFLEHPNIVPVHELGLDAHARPFFTMKLIEGESLGLVLDRLRSGDESYRNEYPLRRLLGIFVQVCNAVSFAHSRGVIHRDLKPDNIMIGKYGEVLVMDWGLAKLRDYDEILAPYNVADPEDFTQTQEGSVIGTPPYMPPEQATGSIEETDERSDVFSLGAILYEMITGKRLYHGTTIAEIISKAVATKFEPPSSIAKVSTDLERICMKALQEPKTQRFQTVKELSERLKAFLDHRVIPEYAVKTWQKLAQSLGVAAFFAFLIPAINISGLEYIAAIINTPSAIMVIGTAACFQIIVSGWRLSFFGKLRRNVDPVAGTFGSIVLQEGAFWGGLLGFLSGYLAMLGNLGNAEMVGPNIALGLITTLYFYAFYIVFRLDSIRELRKNSLFDAIAENSFAHLVRYAVLLVTPIAALFLIIVLTSPEDIFAESRFMRNPGFIPTYPFLVYAFGIGFSLAYCRFVFTFKEMIAALEHAFAYLADNEVSQENRIHAAAVIRMLAETFMLTIAISVALIEIKFLADIVDASEVLPAFTLLVIVGGIAFVLYVLVNFLFVPRFLGYRGAAADRTRMAVRTATFYHESHGGFWTQSAGGRRGLIFSIIGFGALLVMALLASGALLSMPVMFSIVIGASVLIYANWRRVTLKRTYRKMFESSTAQHRLSRTS